MPKINPVDVITIDFDNTLLPIHLSNELWHYPHIGEVVRAAHIIRVYDYKNMMSERNTDFLSYAQNLIARKGASFNPHVISKIISAFESENQKVAIVTFSSFPDVIYELMVQELVSKYDIAWDEIKYKLKIIGGFPTGGQHSPNAKQEHILTALIAFDAVEKQDIKACNVLEIFKDVTLIDDSMHNINQALACGMNAILVRKDGTLDMSPTARESHDFDILDLLMQAGSPADTQESECSADDEEWVNNSPQGMIVGYDIGGASDVI